MLFDVAVSDDDIKRNVLWSESRISLGPISFSLSGIYISFISASITAPPIFLVTYMLRNSRKRKRKNTKDFPTSAKLPHQIGESNKMDTEFDVTTDSQLALPYWCRYVAWTVMSMAVFVSGFFIILYSMEWGKSRSEEWLLCFFLSLFESMFIVDPLKVLKPIINLITVIIRKNRVLCSDDLELVIRIGNPLLQGLVRTSSFNSFIQFVRRSMI